MRKTPEIVVLAGVNGAGKSSIGEKFTESERGFFFNPDTIAAQIKALHPDISSVFAKAHGWQIGKRWRSSRENLIHLLPRIHHLRLYDNSFEADPVAGHRPRPVLLLEMREQKITATDDLPGAPDWPGDMKTISVREMKAHWAEVEKQVQKGETFQVLNRGRPTARIVPAGPREILKWDDHLATAVKGNNPKGTAAVLANREGRW